MTVRRFLAPAIVAAALALTACSNGGSVTTVAPSAPAGSSASSSTSAPPPSEPAPSGSATASPASIAPITYRAPALKWTDCDDQFQCATLVVPVDYADPTGPKFDLAVARLPAADPSERIGSLFVNPGGPGASGVEFLEDGAATFTQQIRNRFDLVTFDPRGVGASDGIRCATAAQDDAYLSTDPDPVNATVAAAYDKATKAFVQGCGPASLLTHVGTADAARDIAVLRMALGEKTLSYFGFSYGTYLGTVLLAIDPTGVRVAVLDGAVDPKIDLVGLVSGQGQAFENAFNRWFAWCTTANGCAFAGASVQATMAAWDALDKASLTSPLSSGGRKLTTAEFLTGTTYPLYSRSLWPQLGTALSQARAGNAAGMLALADAYNGRAANGSYEDLLDANTAINCLDRTGPSSVAAYAAAADALRSTAPRLGPSIVYEQSSCADWPVRADPPPITEGAGAPPVVVVGTTFDPATPYAWAQNLTRDLPTAVLVTHNGDGHTAYGPSAPCIQAIVDKALLTALAPASGQSC